MLNYGYTSRGLNMTWCSYGWFKAEIYRKKEIAEGVLTRPSAPVMGRVGEDGHMIIPPDEDIYESYIFDTKK